jgi:hypothetical protein
MLKVKLMLCGLLAVAGAMPVSAQATSYYFVSVCGTVSQRDCPYGPDPIWFGPFSSYAECDAAWAVWSMGIFNLWPRGLSECIPQ